MRQRLVARGGQRYPCGRCRRERARTVSVFRITSARARFRRICALFRNDEAVALARAARRAATSRRWVPKLTTSGAYVPSSQMHTQEDSSCIWGSAINLATHLGVGSRFEARPGEAVDHRERRPRASPRRPARRMTRQVGEIPCVGREKAASGCREHVVMPSGLATAQGDMLTAGAAEAAQPVYSVTSSRVDRDS